MTEMTRVQAALLELGLEDLIPLPEAIATPGVLAEISSAQPFETIAPALTDLLRKDLVQVWSGHWRADPALVSREAAEALLLDPQRYSYDAEAADTERVYHVNVENYGG